MLAFRRGAESGNSLQNVVGTTLWIAGIASLATALLALALSGTISGGFGNSGLEAVLAILAIGIPATVLLRLLTAIFRGFRIVNAKVIFNDVLFNLSRLAVVGAVALLGLGLGAVLWGYVAAGWLTVGLYLLFFRTRLPNEDKSQFDASTARVILATSVPLLGVALMSKSLGWTGTLMLGYMQGPDQVALFSAPQRLVQFLPAALIAINYLYLPISTRLIKHQQLGELASLYYAASKLSFLVTLPLFLYILVDTEYLLGLLFGDQYKAATNTLRILAIGFAFHTFVGPNIMTMISLGETKTVFTSTVIAEAGAIFICIFSVPALGAAGAALGVAAARVASNLYLSVKLHARVGVFPFRVTNSAPAIFALAACLGFEHALSLHVSGAWQAHAGLFLFCAIVAIAAPLITRSLETPEVELIQAMEQKLYSRTPVANWLARNIVRKSD
jgi:O-antigen/teichoic acid export membrane protein